MTEDSCFLKSIVSQPPFIFVSRSLTDSNCTINPCNLSSHSESFTLTCFCTTITIRIEIPVHGDKALSYVETALAIPSFSLIFSAVRLQWS
jgi:hypothetical protein